MATRNSSLRLRYVLLSSFSSSSILYSIADNVIQQHLGESVVRTIAMDGKFSLNPKLPHQNQYYDSNSCIQVLRVSSVVPLSPTLVPPL